MATIMKRAINMATACIFGPSMATTTASASPHSPPGTTVPPLVSESDRRKLEDAFQYTARLQRQLKEEVEPKLWRFSRNYTGRGEVFERIYGSPFVVKGSECRFVMKEDGENVYARVDMPGVNPKGVRVWFEKEDHNLHFVGEEGGQPENSKWTNLEIARKYSSCIYIPVGIYQTDKIVFYLKHGVLTIVVPQVKIEDKWCSAFVDDLFFGA